MLEWIRMKDKEKYNRMLQAIADRSNLLCKKFPLDKGNLPDDLKSLYSPDTWFACTICLPNDKLIAILEIHGDKSPLVSIELDAMGLLVGEILDEINKEWGKFAIVGPCFQKRGGELSYGDRAYMDHMDSVIGGDLKSAMPKGSKPPSGRYN